MQNSQSTKTPLVSFIVTYHNEEIDMLKECLESILTLSTPNEEREVIVIDDGSDKSPLDALLSYGDNVIYLRKNNEGISTARNLGLRTATGTFVQFIDGDDTLISSTYEHCLDIAIHGNADVVAFDFTRRKETDLNFKDSEPQSGCNLMRQSNIQGASWLYLFRRSILGNLTFTPGISYGEDEEFTPQLLLRAEKVVCTSAKAYFYRQHKNSAITDKSQKGITKRLDDNLIVIKSLKQKADTLPVAERSALMRRVAQLAMDHIYNVITLSRSDSRLKECLKELQRCGLFPLPRRNYTLKYNLFRRMTNSPVGRKALLHTLPYLKRER